MGQQHSITNQGKYKHLSYKERVTIETMLKLGKSRSEIARELKRSKSTITNEINRGTTIQIKQNKDVQIYLADTGQIVYEANRSNSKPNFKALVCQDFLRFVAKKFYHDNWSLDAAYGYAKKQGLFDHMVCTKTLYTYVELGILKIATTDLPEKLKRSTKTSRIKANKKTLGKRIEIRPDISARDTFGHWEIDTLQGIKSKDEPVILTLVERMSRHYIALKIESKTAKAVAKAFESLFDMYGSKFSEVFKTITSDNGSEFSTLDDILKNTTTDVYGAHPYSSSERGSNERHNGLLRRFILKGESIKRHTQESIGAACDWINDLPRKLLNYANSNDIYENELDKIYAI